MNYLVKVRASVKQEDGKVKRVNDTYFVSALSVYEAVVKTSEALKDAYENGFELFEIKESNVSELFGIKDADEPKYFEAKFVIIEQDDSGKVKNHKQTVLVQSDDMRSAYNTFIESMRGTMVDYTEVGLKETAIIGLI